jgi:hypothetical protein
MRKTGQSRSFTKSSRAAVMGCVVLAAGLLAAGTAGADGVAFSTNGLGKVLAYAGCALGIALASSFGAVASAVLGCFMLLAAEV